MSKRLSFMQLFMRFHRRLRWEEDLRPGMNSPCLVYVPRGRDRSQGDYPRIRWRSDTTRRAMYMMILNPMVKGLHLPKGYVIHHLCGNLECVNTDHMVAITRGLHNVVHVINGREPSQMGEASARFLFGEAAGRRNATERNARWRATNPDRYGAIRERSGAKRQAKRLAAETLAE